MFLPHEKEDSTVNIMLKLMSSSMFKEVFIELGSKLLKAMRFKKEQFDFLIYAIDRIHPDDVSKLAEILLKLEEKRNREDSN